MNPVLAIPWRPAIPDNAHLWKGGKAPVCFVWGLRNTDSYHWCEQLATAVLECWRGKQWEVYRVSVYIASCPLCSIPLQHILSICHQEIRYSDQEKVASSEGLISYHVRKMAIDTACRNTYHADEFHVSDSVRNQRFSFNTAFLAAFASSEAQLSSSTFWSWSLAG